MNKIIKLLVISHFLLVLVGCGSKEYKYEESNGKVTISEYAGSDAYVIVPDAYLGKMVDTIDYNTYAYNINIYHVRLSDGIKVIRDCAFWYCTNLESIYIPKGLEEIKECAFYRCDNLKYVFFEDSEANINIEILASNECFKNAQAQYDVSAEDYERIIGYKK